MLRLFFAPGACSLAPHIALTEAGAEFEAIRVNLAANEQRGHDYLAINPKGRVPALATDRGILTENPAILAYIAMTFPAAWLAPLSDPYEFGRLQAFNRYLASTVHVAHAHGPRGTRWADDPIALDELKRKVPATMAACFEQIERDLFVGPWVMGDAYSIADPYLFTIAGWLEADRVDINRFPAVRDHRERMLARDAVRATLARERAA